MNRSLLAAIALSLFGSLALPLQAAEPASTPAATAVAPVAAINLNTADAATLSEALSGIGAAKAEAIVRHREANGPFTQVDDLLEVKGIGAATLEKNRARLTVN